MSLEREADYVILSRGGSIVEPGTVSREAEESLVEWLDNLTRPHLPTHNDKDKA